MNLYEFYSYKLIGKLTAFLQLQESSLCNIIVEVHYRRAAFSNQGTDYADFLVTTAGMG